MAAYPTYFMLGQDAFLGDIAEAWLTEDNDARWLDAEASIDMYHHTNAVVDTYDTTPAAMVSNTQQAGDLTIVAMDASMMRNLFDTDHPTGMAFVKRTDQGNVGNSGSSRWGKTFGEAYANIAAAHTALNTLITGRGDTMDVKGFFLAFGYAEGVTGNTTLDAAFYADLLQLVSDLRTDYGAASTPIVFDFPPATFSGATAAQIVSLGNARTVIKRIASTDANISYVSSDALARSNSTKWYYTGEATIAQGTAMANEMRRLVTGKGTSGGNGAPTYVLIGDTQCVGAVGGDYLEDGIDDDYSRSQDNVKTFNWSNSTWENLYRTTNSNTSTDGTSNFGPDISMGIELQAKHPDEIIYLFKLGRDDSALADADAAGESWVAYNGQIYAEVATAWGTAKTALDSVESKVADVRGIAIMIGAKEMDDQEETDNFLTNLRQVIADYRALFQTRVGEDIPVAIVRMQDTGQFTASRIAHVRTLTDEAIAGDVGAALVNIDDARTATDNTYLSGHGALELGRLLGKAFS